MLADECISSWHEETVDETPAKTKVKLYKSDRLGMVSIPDAEPAERVRGTVKWWNDHKGYGFLEYEGKEIFVHYTGIAGDSFKTLDGVTEVEFDLIEGPKGPQAANVMVISKEKKS
jgi:CspA family cold shock protein